MIYSNINGTSKPSFKIGPRGLSLASSAVIQDETHVLKGFKKVEVSYGDRKETLVYDIEIPSTLVEDCVPDDDNPNIYKLTLFNRETQERREVIIDAGLGHTGVSFSGETAAENNLAAFSDTTGRKIKDSGYSVYAGSLKDEQAAEESDKVPTVSAVYDYVGELTDYLKNRLNGKPLSELLNNDQ